MFVIFHGDQIFVGFVSMKIYMHALHRVLGIIFAVTGLEYQLVFALH